MNPVGLRLEEKKSADEVRSHSSYKSTHSSRSSVLERAREYNRRIDEQRSRAKSLERTSTAGTESSSTSRQRSKSASRVATKGPATRERAMDSVRRDSGRRVVSQPQPEMPRSSSAAPAPRPSPTSNPPKRSVSADPHRRPSHDPDASVKSRRSRQQPAAEENDGQQQAVSPELLVDALSGHEDGLLAIAEKLMEHYDQGYDVMGEAIIDAFDNVQSLFQHVVEAAHIEGAAYEASRREAAETASPGGGGGPAASPALASGLHNRHDEFVDQDVKDILQEAIRQGTSLRDRHDKCLEAYVQACTAASALLPVDSDHRGRLAMSMGRAEATSADRACAILRYSMDDILRSGIRASQAPSMDPKHRADVVLTRPQHGNSRVNGSAIVGVVQSSDEELASLMEELKEILSAPAYEDSPVQRVASKFWTALNDSLKAQQKHEERLEENLGKLKGEFLLARAEWEEKLTRTQASADSYKEKYMKLKESRNAESYMEQARSFAGKTSEKSEDDHQEAHSVFGSVRSFNTPGKAASVASFGSGLAQQARTIVTQHLNQFNCNGMNDRTGPIVDSELRENGIDPTAKASRMQATPKVNSPYHSPKTNTSRYVSPKPNGMSHHSPKVTRSPRPNGGISPAASARSKMSAGTKGSSRTFENYPRTPQKLDV